MNTSVQKTDLIKKHLGLGLKGLGGEEHRLMKARPIKSLSSRRSVFFCLQDVVAKPEMGSRGPSV